jgi:tetratricopeptide (TPR) repeat protein
MLCPRCSTPNPDGAVTCTRCSATLSDADATYQLSPVDGSEAPTVATPEGFAREVAARSFILPEGLEIGSRYRIVRLLGRGGMGAVYRAYDRELDRDVALKIIRPEIAENPGTLERFKREIQLSSRVTHRNVLRVFDLGSADGMRFLTMQYIEGEDLGAVLGREGRLPVPRALAILRQIGEGLRAAHELGVVHRDLKPQNIMLDSAGTVYLTDFGLAKTLEQAGLTQQGAVVGTPYYMSPEQVKGEPIGPKSDIYTLGIILYLMLTGSLPYTGDSAYEVMIQRVRRPPRPAAELNPEIPLYLRRILARCMEIDPSLRYGSLDEVLADLASGTFHTTMRYEALRRRWLRPAAAGAAALVVVGAVGLWFAGRERDARREDAEGSGSAVTSPPVLGVVRFENRTGDSSLDWYGEGVARLVTDSLAQSRHLQVASVDRIESLRARAPDRAALSREAAAAGIGFLLTGEIFPGQEGVTLATRLTETRAGRELASRRIDGLPPGKLLAASDEIAMAAKKGLGVPPTEGVDVFAADFATRNPAAYESYIAGLRALTDYDYPQAERFFASALEKAPDYTMARYRLAHVQASAGRTEEGLRNIQRAVAEAARLPDREQRYVRAAEAYFSRRYDEAARAYRELIQRYAYEIEARNLLSQLLLETGKHEEALEEAKQLARLAPEDHIAWSMLGSAHLALKHFNEAVVTFRRYVELQPESPNAHHLLADSYRCQGELDLAAQEYANALAADPGFHYATTALATVEALQGRSAEAERRLAALVKNERTLPVHRIDAAFPLAYLRRAEGRFAEAEAVLSQLERTIAAEKVRESLALSVRGTSQLERGDASGAKRLIATAIERSPGVPTRYLFAQGLLEISTGKTTDARRTAVKILEGALPPENPDRTEEKAAAYLKGMALLSETQPEEARAELERAVALSGYEYGIYRLGLARSYLAAGRLPEAMAAARQAAAPLDPVDPRLDLELDRRRALLLLAETQLAMGRPADAAAAARSLTALWGRAEPGWPDIAQARRLATAGR